MFKEQQAN